jgi:hypothetical protein
MVSVPTRVPPSFAATANVTLPLELPLVPVAMEIQPTGLDAVQEQPASVETSTATWPPDADTVADPWLSEYRHGAPAWLSCSCTSETMTVPDRATGKGFSATV